MYLEIAHKYISLQAPHFQNTHYVCGTIVFWDKKGSFLSSVHTPYAIVISHSERGSYGIAGKQKILCI